MKRKLDKRIYFNTNRKFQTVEEGKCRGYDYKICSNGMRATAYIKIPKDHPFFEKHYDDITLTINGGLTYSDKSYPLSDDSNSWCIGWDYGHYADYIHNLTPMTLEMRKLSEAFEGKSSVVEGRAWTLEEIRDEVMVATKELQKTLLS